MRGYYVYILESDGHIKQRHELKCDDDAEALLKAAEVARDQRYEVWEGSRKLSAAE